MFSWRCCIPCASSNELAGDFRGMPFCTECLLNPQLTICFRRRLAIIEMSHSLTLTVGFLCNITFYFIRIPTETFPNRNALNISHLDLSCIISTTNNLDTCCALGHPDVCCPVSRQHKLPCYSLQSQIDVI